jgi:hypothetical protein
MASQRAPPSAFSLALPKEKAWQKERLVVWEPGINKLNALAT